jgi:hypothetical protein
MSGMETIKKVFLVDRSEIAYLRMTFESYDGMAVVTTVDPREALVEVLIAPGCLDLVEQLVQDLVKREGVKLIPQIREGGGGGASPGLLPHR